MSKGVTGREPTEEQLPSRAVFQKFNHPRYQCSIWGTPPLYQWQKEVFHEVAKERSRVVLSTPNEAGKTAILVPILGLSVMNAFPGATVFSTAGAEEQIEGQLFKYLDAMVRPYRRYGWKVATSSLTVKAPEVNGLSSRWIGRVPRDAITMEGYHGQKQRNDKGQWVYSPVCLILDEAKSLNQDVLEASFRINPDWLFIVSTPGKDEGMFYDAMDPDTLGEGMLARGGNEISGDIFTYRRIITWDQCPHLQEGENKKVRLQIMEKYGENSSFVKSFLYGMFATDDDENRVFSEKDVSNLRACMKTKDQKGKERKVAHGEMHAAIDVSGGKDKQVLGIRCGAEVVHWEKEQTEDTIALAARWAQTLKEFRVRPTNCKGDSGGGYGEILKMIEANDYFGIQRYMNNQTPKNDREYADRITEDTFEFKALLRSGDIMLPDDSNIVKQCRRRLFVTMSGSRSVGKTKLEPKDKHRHRYGSSPDELETVVMLFSDYHAPHIEEESEYVSPLETKAATHRRSGCLSGLRKQEPLHR